MGWSQLKPVGLFNALFLLSFSACTLRWGEPGEPPCGGQAHAGGHLSSFGDVQGEQWHKRLIHPAERRVCTTRAPVPLHRDQLSSLRAAGISLGPGSRGGWVCARVGLAWPHPQHQRDAAAGQMPPGLNARWTCFHLRAEVYPVSANAFGSKMGRSSPCPAAQPADPGPASP